MNPHITHPAQAELAAYANKRLSAFAMQVVREHLEQCPQCRQVVYNFGNQVVTTPNPANGGTESGSGRRGTVLQPLLDEEEIPEALRNHGKYQVTKKLGAGGMGVVFLARHKIMDREVAIKVMAAKYHDHSQAVERFFREIRTVAKLDHVNIARAYDAEPVDDLQMLVMEYIDGRDLDRLIKRKGPLPIAHACHYIKQAARGLQHAHEQGMVHRDLKPSNLMLTRTGIIKILDFGLARFVSEQKFDGLITQADGPMGTPCFLSPEQALKPTDADIRSDIYSLGCTLYHLLAGRPPFTGETKYQVITAHHCDPPPRIQQFRREVSEDLWQLLQRMLSKNPDERPQEPEELAQLLNPFIRFGSGSSTRINRDDTQMGREQLPILEVVTEIDAPLHAEIVPIREGSGQSTTEYPQAEPMTDAPPPLPRPNPAPSSKRTSAHPPPEFPDLPPMSVRRASEIVWGELPQKQQKKTSRFRIRILLLIGLFLMIVGGLSWAFGIFDRAQQSNDPKNAPREQPQTTGPTVRYRPTDKMYSVNLPGEKYYFETQRYRLKSYTIDEIRTVVDYNQIQSSFGDAPLAFDLKFQDANELLLELPKVEGMKATGEVLRVSLPGTGEPGLDWMSKLPRVGKEPQQYLRTRAYIFNNRIYRLQARSLNEAALKSPDIDAFMESFQRVVLPKK